MLITERQLIEIIKKKLNLNDVKTDISPFPLKFSHRDKKIIGPPDFILDFLLLMKLSEITGETFFINPIIKAKKPENIFNIIFPITVGWAYLNALNFVEIELLQRAIYPFKETYHLQAKASIILLFEPNDNFASSLIASIIKNQLTLALLEIPTADEVKNSFFFAIYYYFVTSIKPSKENILRFLRFIGVKEKVELT